MEQRIIAWTALAVLVISAVHLVWLKAKPLLDDVLHWLVKKRRTWRGEAEHD